MSKKNYTKESVKLRQRKNATGTISLFLDIYRRGQRKYEYLNLYLYPEKSSETKTRNRETLQFAEAIRAKRSIELLNDEYGFKTKRDDVCFYSFVEKLTQGKKSNGILRAMANHVKKYDGRESLSLNSISKSWVEGFVDYLAKSKLKANSQLDYFTSLRQVFNRAARDGIIKANPAAMVQGLRREETVRAFLTVEEIRQLTATHCVSDIIRRSFLFACLTGLRHCDISSLTWSEVQERGRFTRLVFRQKKTGGLEYLDINEQAVELMGERGGKNDRVFYGIPNTYYCNLVLQQWVVAAGIDKHITFHCARHSFAIMMLALGTDIYTVSKLLGHRDISTTQIYAKVLDKAKEAAIANIPNIFG